MRKILVFCSCLLALSCDDGDIQIEALDFDAITKVESCTAPTITSSSLVLFKINGDEALILTLQDGLLKNEVSTEPIISTITSQSQLTYRIFSGNVTTDYFCNRIPLIEPTVVNNIEASSGSVLITTTTEDDITFEHDIKLSDITLETANDQRITDLTINDFGTITTTVNN